MEFIAQRVQKDAITRLEGFVNAPFERISYTDAVELLHKSGKKFDFPVEWGLDLQTEHERWLTEEHVGRPVVRSEEHTSELQSLMRISYAVVCLKKQNIHKESDSITAED